jgi:hypothetical protein
MPAEITVTLKPEGANGVFLSTVSTMGGGRTLEKLEDAMREATRAAREAGTKSKVSLELTIAPSGEGVGGTPLFKVTGKVKKTLPEKPEPASNFFADENDNLSRRNPAQEEMKLGVMEGGASVSKADLKQAATGTGK